MTTNFNDAHSNVTKNNFVPIERETKIATYEAATTKIANMEVVKQVQDQKQHQKVSHRQGFGHSTIMQQPLLFTRKLGHPELVFNDTRVSQTYFDSQAP
jgi:hypothetical protein